MCTVSRRWASPRLSSHQVAAPTDVRFLYALHQEACVARNRGISGPHVRACEAGSCLVQNNERDIHFFRKTFTYLVFSSGTNRVRANAVFCLSFTAAESVQEHRGRETTAQVQTSTHHVATSCVSRQQLRTLRLLLRPNPDNEPFSSKLMAAGIVRATTHSIQSG